MKNYDDIINMKRPISKKYHEMPIYNRASIFAPFAALTGYSDAISDAGVETYSKLYLNDEQKDMINDKLVSLKELKEKEIEIIYFKKSIKKDGGNYISIKGKVKKIDEYNKEIILESGIKIKLTDIFDIIF